MILFAPRCKHQLIECAECGPPPYYVEGKNLMMRFCWIPEMASSHDRPAYAADYDGNITADASKALQFNTEAECKIWIEADKSRSCFDAVEHGFSE